MGGGLPPGPRTGLHDAGTVDSGSLARIGSPAPGAVGTGAKGSAPRAPAASIPDAVVGYAAHRLGRRVGNGECFTLADRALRNAGARSAADYGEVVPDGDYVWGRDVSLDDLRPGDIIQFRDYACEVATVTETETETRTEERVQERPHHTAIVERVGAAGAATVLEQNSPPGAPVVRTALFFRSGRTESEGRTVTVTVRGSFWFYRPQPQ